MQMVATPLRSSAVPTVHPLKIVAVGDSLIYGFGDPVGGGWVERLRRRWMEPDSAGHTLYNLGVRGDGVKQVGQRLEDEFRHRGERRNHVPDLMILSVGVNDSARLVRSRAHQPLGQPTHERNYTEFGEFEAAIATLLDQAQRLCPVLFIGMVPVDEAKMPFLDCFNYNHADQQRYKAATQLACHERQIPYLDIFEIWRQRGEQWWRSRLSLDGLHPNVAGYQSLFTEVLQWQAFIQQTGTNQ